MNRTTLRRITMMAVATLALSTAAAAATSIPVGTRVNVRLGRSLSSESAKVGQSFEGSLAKDIVVGKKVIAKAGDEVRGRVTHVKESGRLKTPGEITIRLTSVNGTPVKSSAVYRKGTGHTKSNVTKIGGGAAAGAVIGALAGGGKGAAIGAGVGAGAGTGVAMATGKKDVRLSAESTYTFTIHSSGAQAKRR